MDPTPQSVHAIDQETQTIALENELRCRIPMPDFPPGPKAAVHMRKAAASSCLSSEQLEGDVENVSEALGK
jgi:hypothetical protein